MDKQGFYKILELKEDATKKEIKKAFYRQVKRYHPDKNPTQAAKEKYLKINEAYQVLIDEEKRLAYDACMNEDVFIQPCSVCGIHSRQPRFVLFDEIDTLKGGVYCHACAAKQQFKSSMKNWRRFFFSPIKTLKAQNNLYGFRHLPDEKNFELLVTSAQGYQKQRKEALGFFLLEQARAFAQTSSQQKKLRELEESLKQPIRKKERNVWRKSWKDALRVYFPIFLIFVFLSAFSLSTFFNQKVVPQERVIVDYKQPEVIPFRFNLWDDTLLYHTNQITLGYQAPTEISGVLTTLLPQTTVRVTGRLPETQWVQVMTSEGLLVYMKTRFLLKGRGENVMPSYSKIVLPEN